jgi:hypothetical protein
MTYESTTERRNGVAIGGSLWEPGCEPLIPRRRPHAERGG